MEEEEDGEDEEEEEDTKQVTLGKDMDRGSRFTPVVVWKGETWTVEDL